MPHDIDYKKEETTRKKTNKTPKRILTSEDLTKGALSDNFQKFQVVNCHLFDIMSFCGGVWTEIRWVFADVVHPIEQQCSVVVPVRM